MKLFKIVLLLITSSFFLLACKDMTEMHNLVIAELQGKTAAEIYEKAEKEFNRKNYSDAIKTYDALNSLYPFNPYAETAQFHLIESYYQESSMEDVISAAEKFIRFYPTSPHAEMVRYLQAKAYFYQNYHQVLHYIKADMSQRDKTIIPAVKQKFAEFLQRYPQSSYREEVQDKLVELQHILADYEYHIAQYYLRKKAYLAALNRATGLIQRYPDTPAAERAALIAKEARAQLQVDHETTHI